MDIKLIKSKFLYGSFDQNTYVISNDKEVVIIDAGAELEDLKQEIKDKKVLAILITHLHFDHIFNIEKLLNEFVCPVYIVKGANDKLTNSLKNASFLISQNMTFNIPKDSLKYYSENLTLGSFDFQIFETPGHSSDCVCILIEDKLFTGDTVFYKSFGRTDLYDSDADKMEESIRKILNIPFKIAYPGHSISFDKSVLKETFFMF